MFAERSNFYHALAGSQSCLKQISSRSLSVLDTMKGWYYPVNNPRYILRVQEKTFEYPNNRVFNQSSIREGRIRMCEFEYL